MHIQFLPILVFAVDAFACDSCYGSRIDDHHVRNVRRMQPSAQSATTSPKAPLAWGQLNFLHTTDTHGWLEGHIKEQNYGADWGDYVSFVKHMKKKAHHLGVDLLLIDTGDLHDGNGLSDASSPNGKLSNPIFENVDYDLLTIGNHELYITEIAEETKTQFARVYGDRYVTSNVEIFNNVTGQFEYIGQKFRYFTTQHGLKIMSFGVLFDFTGNSNVSRVTKTADLVKQDWFLDAVRHPDVDLFLVIGHNPTRLTASTSTFGTIYRTIRGLRPDIPIQAFGGHTHIRDFSVYDISATGMESGRYCETLGFLSVSGFKHDEFRGVTNPVGVPNPTQRAVKVSSSNSTNGTSTGSLTGSVVSTGVTASKSTSGLSPSATSAGPGLLYSRRYLDWNRLTFAYHAPGSQGSTFDTRLGLHVTSDITKDRMDLNLTSLYGCAPETWCMYIPMDITILHSFEDEFVVVYHNKKHPPFLSLPFSTFANHFDDVGQYCKPFGADGNIFGLLTTALAATVINPSRASIPRLIIINTGSIRFDLVEGPFTFDDSFIVSPFSDGFEYIPSVPYALASKVLPILNAGPYEKRDESPHPRDLHFNFPQRADSCVEGMTSAKGEKLGLERRSQQMTRGLHRRQSQAVTPGYVTYDDFGSDGDDTPHSAIPNFPQPDNIQANASFPADGSLPDTVDLIFLDFIGGKYVIPALKQLGATYTTADVSYYLPATFTTNSYLPAYAKLAWQATVPNCPVGQGVGFGPKQ